MSTRRFKIVLFNFVGQPAKYAFGLVDQVDACYYSQQISSLEKEQTDILKLSDEQIVIIKSASLGINIKSGGRKCTGSQ